MYHPGDQGDQMSEGKRAAEGERGEGEKKTHHFSKKKGRVLTTRAIGRRNGPYRGEIGNH